LSLARTETCQAPDSDVPDEPAVVALVDRAVATRDQAAFGALYDRFLDRVYRYLYYRTGSQAEAEDLTEQVFLKAWEAIDRFRWQGRPFLAWLYRLAHNVHIDHVRRRRHTISLNDEERPIELASETATAALAQRLDAELLARAVRKLTPEQQQVIILKFMDGFENAQIAQIMDKREGAIRALQLRALLSLRRILEEQGEP
jgi:RNA polymerase sigma-70 factor (ECF subfamily)